MKTLEHFANQLREKDSDTLPHRALRLQKIDAYTIAFVPNIRAWDYAREAKHTYINGYFRSSIICSSIVVEQSFIHELIVASDNWEETYWEIVVKKMTFGKILKEVKNKNIEKLKPFIEDARWLKDVRNKVAAHPTYISDYFELKDPYQIIWANKNMFRDLRRLLQFVNLKRRKKLEMAKITVKDTGGKILGQSVSLKEFLNNPERVRVDVFIDWWTFESGLLGELALEAYERMSKVMNGLYYHK